jgi:hypothetical protein
MTDNNSTLQYDGFDEEPQPSVEPPKGGQNRTFLAAIGILGGIFLIALIALIVFAAIILPQRNAQRVQQNAQIMAQNTATAQWATDQAKLSLPTATLPPTATVPSTPTPVIAVATKTLPPPTPTEQSTVQAPPGGDAAKTATVAALLTQAAGARTPVGPTPTPVMPNTGIADQFALPGLMGAALLLVVVIFVARRLRLTSHS